MAKHQSWGDSIFFNNWETRQISGHMTPLPEKGDFIIKKMESGKTGLFKIIEIKPCADPQDQFFGTVTDLGYVEDIQKAMTELGGKLQKAFKPINEALENLVNAEGFQKFLIEYHRMKTTESIALYEPEKDLKEEETNG